MPSTALELRCGSPSSISVLLSELHLLLLLARPVCLAASASAAAAALLLLWCSVSLVRSRAGAALLPLPFLLPLPPTSAASAAAAACCTTCCAAACCAASADDDEAARALERRRQCDAVFAPLEGQVSHLRCWAGPGAGVGQKRKRTTGRDHSTASKRRMDARG